MDQYSTSLSSPRMEPANSFPYELAATIAAFLFAAWFWRTSKPKQPTKWPVIGHLHLLLGGGAAPLHAKLAALADRYGPVMHLSLGSKSTVVVSDASTAKECYTTNDLVFASRPRLSVGKILGFDFTGLPWASYGQLWRELRKICMLELLAPRRLQAAAYIRDEETRHCVRDLHKLCLEEKDGPAKVEMRDHLVDLILRVIMRMIAGRSSSSFGHDEEAKELKEIAEEAFVLAGKPNIGDSLPFLKWLDLQGSEKAMRRLAFKMETMAQSWLDRRRKMIEEETEECKEKADFLDVLFSVEKDNQYLASLSPARRNLLFRANLQVIVLASMDTSSVTLEWALSLLVTHPEAMKRSQEELNTAVGTERTVEESDIQNLPFLQAVVKETFRLHPAGPLLVPHESTEECVVSGTRVSKGTQLLINAWKIHRDPTVWRNPLEFEPERFLGESADIDVKGRHFQLLPFGSGRRICPGISLAMSVLHLTLARLLHSFNFLSPDGDSSTVDMREGLGLSCPKHVPLEVILVPRLPSRIY